MIIIYINIKLENENYSWYSDYDSVHTIVGMVLTIWYMILTITGGATGTSTTRPNTNYQISGRKTRTKRQRRTVTLGNNRQESRRDDSAGSRRSAQ